MVSASKRRNKSLVDTIYLALHIWRNYGEGIKALDSRPAYVLGYLHIYQVRADIIGPGTMLLRVINNQETENDSDPFNGAFLSFLEKDGCSHPENITSVSETQMAKIADLTAGITASDDDCLD